MKFFEKLERNRCGIVAEGAILVLFVLFIGAISWRGMTAPLLLDDIGQAEFVGAFDSWVDTLKPDVFGLFRPVKNLVFYGLGDASVFHWHLFSLGAFLAACLAVYALFRQLFGAVFWAWAGTFIWSTAPTQVSTVVWMSAVNLSLAMVFSCICLMLYDRSRAATRHGNGMFVLACLSLSLAQVCYEACIALPVLCVILDAFRTRQVFSRKSVVHYGVLGATTAVFLWLRATCGAVHSARGANFGFLPEMEPWQLFLSAPWLLWKHFLMWVAPFGRIEFCSTYLWGKSATGLELAGAWVWLGLLVVLVVLLWKRIPMISIGILWFFAASFPSSNFVPIWSGPVEDYYLFFPSLGLVFALVGGCRVLIQRVGMCAADPFFHKTVVWAALLIVLVWRLICVPYFWFQVDLWNRPLELYLRAETSRSHQFLLQAAAATELMKIGELEQAKIMALKAHETGPWYPFALNVLGTIAMREKNYTEAESYFRKIIGVKWNNKETHDFLRLQFADALDKQGKSSREVREALMPLLVDEKGSFHRDAAGILIQCYLKFGQLDDALRATRTALKFYPSDADLMLKVSVIENQIKEKSVKEAEKQNQ